MDVQARLDDVNSTVQENLTNIRVVKSFVRRDLEISKFKKATENLQKAAVKAFNLVVLNFPLMMLIMNVTTIAVLWVGGRMIMNGTLEYGMLISFFTYIFQILFSLLMLAMIVMNISQSKASLTRIYEAFDTETEIKDGENENALVRKGKVEFRNVCFKYDEKSEECVLKDISFTVEPGQFVAIVGQTGSAKTSLVQLIPRLYDTTDGQVLIDDIDVRNYKLENLRSGIGIVMQKNNLFSGSISENITWGKQDAERQEIEAAANIAQAHDFITKMPQGYDSELVSGGMNLSGGQKQRVCIARAIIKKPPILIMDDSTSAVDSATEMKIREALNLNLKDTTVFIIAQRISSVRNADKIIVLDNGTIAGIGSHEELLKNNECYRAIYYSQQREVKE
jgi:ATP-binding cassette subfamily B protein